MDEDKKPNIKQKFLQNQILGIGGQLGGAIMSPLTDWLGLNSAKNHQELQIAGAKEMADYNKNIALELWDKTGYGAQRKQMEAAGLNPALMYGQAGAGGTTSGGGGQMPSAGAQQTGIQRQMLGLEMAKQHAEIAKLNADANLANTNANKLGGIDTEVGKATVDNLRASINLAIEQTASEKVKRAGWQLDNTFKGIQNYIADMTADSSIRTVEYLCDQALKQSYILAEQFEQEQIKTRQGRALENDVVERYRLEMQDTAVGILLKMSQTKLNETEAWGIVQEISQTWVKIAQKNKDIANDAERNRVAMEQVKASVESSKIIKSGMMWSAGIQAGGRVLETLIKILNPLDRPLPIKGFGK